MNIVLKANPRVGSRVNLSLIIAVCSQRRQHGRLEQNSICLVRAPERSDSELCEGDKFEESIGPSAFHRNLWKAPSFTEN